MTKREQVQKEALDIAIKNKRCGLGISMGVGKTLIGLNYIKHFQEKNMDELRVLVVAPKLSIFESWKSDAKTFKVSINNVTFSTYLSLNKLNPSDYDLVILDECHSLLDSHLPFLGAYGGRILGLTGTPPRYSNSEKGKIVTIFCPILYKYITDDAIDDKILNDYKILVHLMNLSSDNNILVKAKNKEFYTSEVKNYNYWCTRVASAKSKKEQHITAIMRMKALMEYKTKEKYAKSLLEKIEEKCIVFCNTQAQADYICQNSVHSNNVDADDNLQKFKNGDIDKLSCVLQLNEGVNIPNLRQGIIMHSYGNERKSSQRIGRLLRLNPKDRAVIHILCYKGTADERWVTEALSDFDQNKIKYFDVD